MTFEPKQERFAYSVYCIQLMFPEFGRRREEKVRDIDERSSRNIFIEENSVAFVATYHEGNRSSGNIKIIHRYLPREVRELVVYGLTVLGEVAVPYHRVTKQRSIFLGV